MKSFVQYGAGNIGRGFIGQIFSEAGYFVHFIDVDPELINGLNQQKQYPINIVSNVSSIEVLIENIDCINAMESESVAEAIASCDLMATAVGVHILPHIVPNIVAGFRKRIENGNTKPLNIIICENLIDADKLLYKLIIEHLSSDEIKNFDKTVGLIEASVGRMVPVMTEEQKKDNPLRLYVESYCELPVDKDAFKGDIPEVKHLIPFSPFEYYIKRKLFIHNMGHAMAAYLGNLSGFQYIWQAIENPEICSIVRKAMNESAAALSKKFNIPLDSINEYIDDLLVRFGNKALGDTVIRVGKDTLRKLSVYDRFAGAIRLCQEQGVKPGYIPIGIAAGLLYEGADDPGSKSITDRVKRNGLDEVISDVCGLSQENVCIKAYYYLLKEHSPFAELIRAAESYELIPKNNPEA